MDCYVYIESIWRAEIECGMEQLIPHYKNLFKLKIVDRNQQVVYTRIWFKVL